MKNKSKRKELLSTGEVFVALLLIVQTTIVLAYVLIEALGS